jgi:hypothetical protein
MQTSPLLFENTSFICPYQITTLDEHQSYDTTIPFFDDAQRNSTSMRSCETSLKQSRTRKCSRLSERPMTDNESTVTVNFPIRKTFEIVFFSFTNPNHTLNTLRLVKFYLMKSPMERVFHRKVSPIHV